MESEEIHLIYNLVLVILDIANYLSDCQIPGVSKAL